MNRIEEVHPDELVRPAGRGGHFRDTERRSIGCENGLIRACLIESAEDVEFQFHFLGHGLDDQLCALCGAFQVIVESQAGEGCIHIGIGQLADADCFVQVLTNSRLRFL